MSKSFRFELAIVAISALMYVVVASVSIKVKSFGDMDFHREALKIAHCLHGEGVCDNVSLSKAPLPSIYYSIPYSILSYGSSDTAYWLSAVIWSAFWITMALLLLNRACKNFTDNYWSGIIAIGFSLMIPLHVYYGLGVLAEAPAFVATSFALFGWSVMRRNVYRGLLIYFLGIILLILARPNAVLILPMIMALSGFFWWKGIGGVNIQRGLLVAAGASTLVVLIIFSLAKSLPGNSSASQENYLLHVAQHGRFQFRDETWDWRFWDDDVRADSKDYQRSNQVKSRLDSTVRAGNSYGTTYGRWLINDVLSNPVTAVKQFIVRIIYGHTLTINSITKERFSLGPLRGPFGYYLVIGGLNLINWSIILLAGFGIYTLRRDWTVLIPILIPWAALVLFSAAIYMEQRYLFPVRPIVLLLASVGVMALFRKLQLLLYPNSKQ